MLQLILEIVATVFLLFSAGMALLWVVDSLRGESGDPLHESPRAARRRARRNAARTTRPPSERKDA